MAYKNSGAMKFNDATDLVIRADPDGTVESVFNKADGVEYINQYSALTNVNLTIKNNKSASVNFQLPVYDNGYITGRGISLAPGATFTRTILKNGMLFTATSGSWNVVSGDCTVIDSNNIVISGDASIVFGD